MWKMLAVTFKRAKPRGSTLLEVHFDMNKPLSYEIQDAIYTDQLSRVVYVGLNFAGIIRSLVIYSKYSYD